MAHVTGVIGISSGELARYAVFYDSVLHLSSPPNTALVLARGANIAENRNNITRDAIDMGAEWIWYIDDDQVFRSDTLLTLLNHNVDVVSGLYVHRSPPFMPVMFDWEDPNGHVHHKLLVKEESGLVPVVATGAGCLLVKTKVIKAMEPPYWTLGQLQKDAWCDDVDFCRRVREKGFKIWCDLDMWVGHQFNGTLWPTRNEHGEWITSFVKNSDCLATWPAAALVPDAEEGK